MLFIQRASSFAQSVETEKRELQQLKQNLVTTSREVEEANTLSKDLGNNLRFTMKLRISLKGEKNKNTKKQI